MKKLYIYIILTLLLSSFVSATPVYEDDSDLIGYWKFDGADVKLEDSKTNSLVKIGLNFSGTAGELQQPCLATTYCSAGAGDYSIDFDNQYYADNRSATTKSHIFSLKNYTVGCWIDSGNADDDTVFSVRVTNDGWYIRTSADSGGQMAISAQNFITYNLGDAIVGLLVGNCNGTDCSIWLNGTQRNTGASNPNGVGGGGLYGIQIGAHLAAHSIPFDGKLDDCFLFNRSLSEAEIMGIYDNGILKVAVAGVPEAPTIQPPSPADNSNNNTNVTLSVSHSTPSNDVRYYLYFGTSSTLDEGDLIYNNVTRNGSEYSTWITNVSDGIFYWKWRIQNITDAAYSLNTTQRTLTIDTVNPAITIYENTSFKTDNSTIISSYITDFLNINISFFDTYLYQTLINITNSTDNSMFSILNNSITGTTANYTQGINISGWAIGNYTIKLSATDSHTAKSIEPYDIRTGLSYFRYTTEEGNVIKITSDTLPLTKRTTKFENKYDFEFSYLFQKNTYKFIIESYNKINYIKGSDYKAHFVIMGADGEGNWIDFENPYLNKKDYKITKIDDYTYEVEITANGLKEFTFSSIGGLNKVEKHYLLRIGSVLDIWVFDETLYPLQINATVTIGTKNANNSINISGARFVNITKETTSLTINSTGYTPLTQPITITGNYHNLSFNMTPLNQSRLFFYDEETNNIIDYVTISVDVFSDNFSDNYTTSTGYVFVTHEVDVITTIRYSADGYYERFYFASFPSNVTNVTLYMVNSSTADVITTTVYNQNNELFEGIYIKALRYDTIPNNYKLVEMGKTNFEGETHLHMVQNSEYYKFMLYYPFQTLRQTTEPTYIRSTSILFQINIEEDVAEDFHKIMNVNSNLVFNNVTNRFIWTYSDSNNVISRGCMDIYKITAFGFNESIDRDCVAAASGVITTTVTKENGTTYLAQTYATLSGEDWFIESLTYTYPSKDSNPAQFMGLLIAFIMTIAFAFAFKYSVELGVIAIPLPLLFCSIMGIVDIATPITVGIEIAAIVLAIILNKVID